VGVRDMTEIKGGIGFVQKKTGTIVPVFM